MRVKLLKPHRHRGRDYPVGAEITLADHKAQWLVDIGTAAPSKDAAEPSKDAAKSAKAKE
jgi:hypothetical protein